MTRRAIGVVVAGVLRALAWTPFVLAGAMLVRQAVAYAAAARRRPVCPFEDADPTPRPARALAWLRMFVAEYGARLLLTLSWPLALLPPRLEHAPGRRPVVLVHDHAQHRATLLWLARRLQQDGRPAYRVRLRTVWTDLERSAARLAAATDRVRSAAGAAEIVVVAHGVGGLVVRAALRRGMGGVHRVVTLGTPHQGTIASGWLGLDPMHADPVPAATDFVAIHSTDDAAIVPTANGYYPGAFNIEVRGHGHASLVLAERVYALVGENLAAEDTPRAAAKR